MLDSTGPPQPQGTGQQDPPLHNLANNHADDERLRQIVTGQANLARVPAGVGIEALGKDDGKRIGELLALAGSADVVDAHVALMTAPADLVLTSDSGDIRKLLQARGIPARVQGV